MNELLSLGVILLFALLAGHLVKFLRVPEVTGYILAGIAVGPSGLGWLTHENLTTLGVFSEVALGLILFSVGFVFEFSRMRAIGAGVIRVTLAESLLSAGLVSGSMLALGQDWQVSLLLGAIAMETAAASTLMVLREVDSEGPLSDTLLGVIGVNNVFCLAGFMLVAALLDLTGNIPGGGSLASTLYQSLFPLVWQLLGSIALGYLAGLLLASWATRIVEHGELIILLSGCILLCVGGATILDLSPLVTSLALGATIVNLSGGSKRMFGALSRTDPPLYAIFFVIAGADLNLSLLTSLGVLGVVYVVARTGGKFVGARVGSRRAGLPPAVQRYLGFTLMSQAGLAIGLTLAIDQRFPQFGPAVGTVVLAAVVIYEMVGPLSARLALVRSGEAKMELAATRTPSR